MIKFRSIQRELNVLSFQLDWKWKLYTETRRIERNKTFFSTNIFLSTSTVATSKRDIFSIWRCSNDKISIVSKRVEYPISSTWTNMEIIHKDKKNREKWEDWRETKHFFFSLTPVHLREWWRHLGEKFSLYEDTQMIKFQSS